MLVEIRRFSVDGLEYAARKIKSGKVMYWYVSNQDNKGCGIFNHWNVLAKCFQVKEFTKVTR